MLAVDVHNLGLPGVVVCSFTWVFMHVFGSPLMTVTTILGCLSVTVLPLSPEDPGLGPPQDRNQTACF